MAGLRHKITVSIGEQEPPRSFVRVMKKSARAALDYLGADVACSVDISLVGEAEMKEMNARTREIDRVTDVLSFPMLELKPGELVSECAEPTDYDTVSFLGLALSRRAALGYVVICYPRALKQAIEYNHPYARELGFLTVHSMLHLFGYDHMTKPDEELMTQKAEEILNSIGLKR